MVTNTTTSTTTSTKVRENRLRRAAHRQGLRLEKSRARDPRGITYGTYQLVDPHTNTIVYADWAYGRGYGLALDDVEQYLSGGDYPDWNYGRGYLYLDDAELRRLGFIDEEETP